MKAKVIPETCIGCGICVGICPEVFRMVDGKAVVIIEVVPPDLRVLCRQAAADCPVQAIEIKET